MTDIPPPTPPATVIAVSAPPKPVLASRTVISAGVAILATVAQHYGHTLAGPDQATLVDAITQLLQYGGMAAAVLFRVLATKPLK